MFSNPDVGTYLLIPLFSIGLLVHKLRSEIYFHCLYSICPNRIRKLDHRVIIG
ncbi:Uncharacterized protein dnm_037230 [Desulfonema magnum]|uniref:Uncharacterized protein n=1 Tax=Desulfonema magnum TaxID=45655 RepID=A0A975GNE6_9BACT|nr:Uncharacterized protein dnm_037230 [Desulfonema magnum]